MSSWREEEVSIRTGSNLKRGCWRSHSGVPPSHAGSVTKTVVPSQCEFTGTCGTRTRTRWPSSSHSPSLPRRTNCQCRRRMSHESRWLLIDIAMAWFEERQEGSTRDVALPSGSDALGQAGRNFASALPGVADRERRAPRSEARRPSAALCKRAAVVGSRLSDQSGESSGGRFQIGRCDPDREGSFGNRIGAASSREY
jgi:hypothetical protein